MPGPLSFDNDAARRIERAYLTPDIVAQRSEVMSELAPCRGESVLDIGIGPGLLTFDLADAVGKTGSLLGIDTSEAMVEMTQQRCAEQSWARFEVADACSLPCHNDEIDCAVSTQVYEYVADIPKALEELLRVLRPGGRALILDTDYDSLVLRTESSELTARILSAWDEHFVHRGLPRELSGHLRRAGFAIDSRSVLPLLNADYHPDTFSYGLVRVMASFAAGRQGIGADETRAWIAELDNLGQLDEYFFSLNRYLFLVRKPT